MKFVNKIKKIKKALLKGGLVISNRNTGKTAALAEILTENSRAIVITPTEQQKQRLVDMLIKDGTLTPKEINERVLIAHIAKKKLFGNHQDYIHEIYLDEYFINSYNGPYTGAVSSLPFNTQVID